MRALALLLLASCVTARPAPDSTSRGVQTYWNGHPKLAHVEDAVDLLRAQGQALCPASRRTQLAAALADVQVFFVDYPSPCAGQGIPVGGCQPYIWLAQVQVGWKPTLSATTLPDELEHEVWEMCWGRTGEHLEGGKIVGDPDYSAAVASLRSAIAGLEQKDIP